MWSDMAWHATLKDGPRQTLTLGECNNLHVTLFKLSGKWYRRIDLKLVNYLRLFGWSRLKFFGWSYLLIGLASTNNDQARQTDLLTLWQHTIVHVLQKERKPFQLARPFEILNFAYCCWPFLTVIDCCHNPKAKPSNSNPTQKQPKSNLVVG